MAENKTYAKTQRDSLAHGLLPTLNKVVREPITSGAKVASAVVLSLGSIAGAASLGYLTFAASDRRSYLQHLGDAVSVFNKRRVGSGEDVRAEKNGIDRYDYTQLWSLQLGDYFMPVSQTFSLRAKKRLNVSSLVDGIDIIQQTRKEAKTVDCTLRLTLRNNQPNLMIARNTRAVDGEVWTYGFDEYVETEVQESINNLASFLSEFYENDGVFIIKNKMINETFGINYVFISEYQFLPKVGMGTFEFKFSLTEVQYGDDVLTFDVREINGD